MALVRLKGWRPGMNKVRLALLLRDNTELGLKPAKQVVDEVVAGGEAFIAMSDRPSAVDLCRAVEELGVTCAVEVDEEVDPPSGHSRDKVIQTALATGIAALEYMGLVWYATGAFLDDYRSSTDMPFGYVIAFVLFLTVACNIAAACWFFLHARRTAADVYERLQWTAGISVIAPWIAVVLSLSSFWYGPVGWVTAPIVGSIAPYVLIGRSVRGTQPRPQ